MIRSLRRRHLRMVLLVAALSAAAVLGGLLARRAMPHVERLPAGAVVGVPAAPETGAASAPTNGPPVDDATRDRD